MAGLVWARGLAVDFGGGVAAAGRGRDLSAVMADAAERRLAEAIVAAAAGRWIAACRGRVDPFVDRHFTLAGSLTLHRYALGWDLLRAPANMLLAAPALIAGLLGRAAAAAGWRRFGDLLLRRKLLFETAVAREIERRLLAEVFETPDGGPDGLAAAILGDRRVAERLAPPDAPAWSSRIAAGIASYGATRAAAAEIATGALAMGVGAVAVKQATPGLVTLASAFAGLWAQQAAIAAFPLGAALGRLWYGWFPVAPQPGLVALATFGFVVAGALVATFSGILTDPLQRRLGLHRRRLMRLCDAIESAFGGQGAGGSLLRDHYVARLLDLFDLAALAWRATRG